MKKNYRNHRVAGMVAMAAAASMLAASCSGGGSGGDSGDMSWGSASTGSDSFVMVQALTKVASDHSGSKNSGLSTAGSLENTALVSQGELQFGTSTSDTLFSASEGNEPFNEEPIDVQQVMGFVYWTVPIIAPTESGIDSIEDLKGKTIGIGVAGQSSASIIPKVLEAHGLSDKVKTEFIDGQEAADALAAGQIDAATVSHLGGSNLTPAFQELAQTTDLHAVDMDKKALEKVTEAESGLIVSETSKKTAPSYDKTVPSIATTGILIADPELGEDTVYDITKAVLENADEARKIDPNRLTSLTKKFAVEGLTDAYPVHPGAKKYFKEEGLWVEPGSQPK